MVSVQALLAELEEDEKRKAADAQARKAKKERRQDIKKQCLQSTSPVPICLSHTYTYQLKAC